MRTVLIRAGGWKADDHMTSIYLPFEIDGAEYAVPIEYVYAILSASEDLPSCVPPRRPPYVERLVLTEQNLVPVIEWSRVTGREHPKDSQLSRTMLVILRHQKRMLGILADRAAAPFTEIEPRLEQDATKIHTLLICKDKQYILFDIPTVFYNLGDIKCE